MPTIGQDGRLAVVSALAAGDFEAGVGAFDNDASRCQGLNPFLAHDPGVDSGHMIAQYTQAAIVSELKRLAAPASVDSIPSAAIQEDHVSMGWSAARKLRKSVDGLTRVLVIEVLTAARGIDLRALVAGTGHRCSSRCCANTRAGPRHRSISGTRDRSSRSTRPKRRLGRSRRSHYRPATLTRCSVKRNNGDVHSTRPTLPSHFADGDLAFSF